MAKLIVITIIAHCVNVDYGLFQTDSRFTVFLCVFPIIQIYI